MTRRPPTSRFAGAVFDLLPDYIRVADERLDASLGGPWLLLRWLGAAAGTCDRAVAALDSLDPVTAPGGVSGARDPRNAPAQLLPWLAMLTGMWPDYLGLPPDQLRQVLALPVDARRRGSLEAVRQAVRTTLTGTRTVSVTVDPADPWTIHVSVVAAEVPDLKATEAAAQREKPAGSRLVVSTAGTATHSHTVGSLAGRVRGMHGHTVGELRGTRSGHTHTVGGLAGR